MAVNGVEIKVGQVWRTRGGKTAKIISNDGHAVFAWDVDFGDEIDSVDDDGFHLHRDGSDPNDLVFLVSDPDVGKERRVAQTENSPLRRKDDYPPVPADLPDLASPPEDFAASVPGVLDDPLASVASVGSHYVLTGSFTSEEVAAAIGAKPFVPARLEPAPSVMGEHVGGPTALDRQVGGSHYKTFAIQPVEFIHKNKIGFAEGNAIKYLCRWREKGGVADLEKAKHYIDLLIQMESQA